MSEAYVVLTTLPDRAQAVALGRALVEEKLAACVNVLDGVTSIYAWKGQVQEEAEVLCAIKTTVAGFEALRARIVALHPYELPEVVALPIAAAHAPYLAWLTGLVG